MDQSNDIIQLFRIIYKWRKPIIIVTILTIVISSLVSWFFMPDYYKSSVTFYPSNPVMNDRQVLYSTSMGELKIDYFGSSSDVDRVLTMAHTSSVEDYIITKYHLIDHYGFDSTKEMSRYYTKQKFEKNYKALETEYGAVEITIWDTDRNLASQMANHIVETIDAHTKDLIYNDKKIILKTFQDQIDIQNEKIKLLSDSIEKYKSVLSEQDMEVLQKDFQSALDNRNENIHIQEQYQTSANTNYSTVHITEEAYPALRKDKPKRSIIVIGATLAAFLFMVILAVFTYNFRRIKNKIVDAEQ